jgi:rhomboid protease GluP
MEGVQFSLRPRHAKALARLGVVSMPPGQRALPHRAEDTAINVEPLETAVRITPSAHRATEWATVLAASRIRHRLVLTATGWAVVVASDDTAKATAALAAYDRENRQEEHAVAPPVGRDSIALGVAVAALLLGFFAVTGPRRADDTWFQRGSASATRIQHGEVWRTITALTLHADLAHVLGNAVACVVLIPPVSQALGPGTGLWVLLLSGAAGNALTALVHSAPYSSVGASTLTFGAIGVLTAQAFVERWRGRSTRRRLWVVIVASLVLLLMLGTAEGADVLGHFFGLLAGTVLGLPTGLARLRSFAPATEWALVVAAMALVVACWRIA